MREGIEGMNMSRSKTFRRSAKKNKIDLNQVVEFFDPIRKKKALSKKYRSTKIKDKGSTQKHAIFNKKVPTDSSTQNEHGLITFYGNVLKQRFRFNKFHLRWVMLRGFTLYWYRSPLDRQQKGQIVLPSANLQVSRVGANPCFVIPKEDGG